MNQPNESELSIFSKLISIWVVITILVIITAIITGSQVYWWQKTIAEKEKTALTEEIAKLQNEINILKSDLNPVQKLGSNPKIDVKAQNLKEMLAGREKIIITILKNREFGKLADYVHPLKGVRFSPYSYVDVKNDLVFSAAQLSNFFWSKKRYIWGYNEENGLPIRLTPPDYFKMYVYDQDYINTDEVSFSQKTSSEFTTNNCFEIYPRAICVEFRLSEYTPKANQNTNWRSIRLAFEERGKIWYLVGVIHDQWQL